MILRIEHETQLTWSEPVSESVIEVHMGPLSSEDLVRINASGNRSNVRLLHRQQQEQQQQ